MNLLCLGLPFMCIDLLARGLVESSATPLMIFTKFACGKQKLCSLGAQKIIIHPSWWISRRSFPICFHLGWEIVYRDDVAWWQTWINVELTNHFILICRVFDILTLVDESQKIMLWKRILAKKEGWTRIFMSCGNFRFTATVSNYRSSIWFYSSYWFDWMFWFWQIWIGDFLYIY